jgi:hypothetical protein
MKFMKKNLCLQCDSDEEDANPFGNSFSCEIGSDGLKFIKENLQVHQEGLKNIETGEFLANIHPKDLLVLLISYSIPLVSKCFGKRSKWICTKSSS